MRLGIVILIMLFTFLTGFAQIEDSIRGYQIDSIVAKYAKEYSIVGLSIGIVHNGKESTKHYGHTNLTNNHPVGDNTMFHLASISKLYTATAIMQLVERDKLSLEDNLVDVLPDFKMKDKRHSEIRIKHLLTHSSGLKWNNKLKESPDDASSISLYIQNLQKEKLNFDPGEQLSYDTYSNVGYDLLGAVIEKISGQSFDEYVQQNILRPLRMNRSRYYYEDIDSSLLAIPQIVTGNSKKVERLNLYGIDSKKEPIVNGEPLELRSYEIYGEEYEHNPSGNLISSASEQNSWMQHNLEMFSNSSFNGILEQASMQEMWTTQKEIPNKTTSIGWGWWIHQDEELGRSVFHVGNNPGFSSIMIIYPEENFGITVLCNGWYAQEAVWNKITENITYLYIGK